MFSSVLDDVWKIVANWISALSTHDACLLSNNSFTDVCDVHESFFRTMYMGGWKTNKYGQRHVASSRKRVTGNSNLRHCLNAFETIRRGEMRFIITREGCMGLAPPNIQVADRIAIFASGRLPFALRRVKIESPQPDAHILLGGCYIDGKKF